MRRIRRNDNVVVIAGKELGKQGQVRQVLPEKQRIVETRPLSKTKNWRLAEIVERAR